MIIGIAFVSIVGFTIGVIIFYVCLLACFSFLFLFCSSITCLDHYFGNCILFFY